MCALDHVTAVELGASASIPGTHFISFFGECVFAVLSAANGLLDLVNTKLSNCTKLKYVCMHVQFADNLPKAE